MKRNLLITALFAVAIATPAFAQDKPAADPPKAEAAKVKATGANQPTKRHSHLEERHGIKPSAQPAEKKESADKRLHSHPQDR